MTSTGRPETVKANPPSVSSVPRAGAVETMLFPGFERGGRQGHHLGRTEAHGPRTTTSDDRTRSSTGTAINDGSGGAVRDAISAGERICLPANQPTPEATTTTASPIPRVVCRCIRQPGPPGGHGRYTGASDGGTVLDSAAIARTVGSDH